MKCAAKYDKKCVVYRLSGSVDAHGHVDATSAANWSPVTAAYCSCVSKGGREFWKVQQVNADVSHVWTTQHTKTLAACTPDMRLVCEGVTYEILSVVDVDEAHDQIQIQTRRQIA